MWFLNKTHRTKRNNIVWPLSRFIFYFGRFLAYLIYSGRFLAYSMSSTLYLVFSPFSVLCSCSFAWFEICFPSDSENRFWRRSTFFPILALSEFERTLKHTVYIEWAIYHSVGNSDLKSPFEYTNLIKIFNYFKSSRFNAKASLIKISPVFN